MVRSETVEEFASDAPPAQAALFVAACAERAAAVLLWVVSLDGRAADLDTYTRVLDSLWSAERLTSEDARAARERVTGFKELTVGDEATGAHAFAYQGAVALYTALGVHVEAGERSVMGCSSALRNFAFRLGRRCNVELLSGEHAEQLRDVADLTAATDASMWTVQLRERSRAVGRRWLGVAVERFR